MQEKNDKLVKKKQNKVAYGLSILPSIPAYYFAAGMNHTPPIQGLSPKPRTSRLNKGSGMTGGSPDNFAFANAL
jgi:hypothetical protein